MASKISFLLRVFLREIFGWRVRNLGDIERFILTNGGKKLLISGNIVHNRLRDDLFKPYLPRVAVPLKRRNLSLVPVDKILFKRAGVAISFLFDLKYGRGDLMIVAAEGGTHCCFRKCLLQTFHECMCYGGIGLRVRTNRHRCKTTEYGICRFNALLQG